MNRDGALLAARVAVLAAEVADVERYRRGRAYARQGAVTMTAVDDGVLSGTVQGSRPDPYVVELRIRGRSGRRGPVPSRDDVRARCTCPDDVPACKHAVAVLLSFAEIVAEDPDALAEWTGTRLEDEDPDDVDVDADAERDELDDNSMPEFFGVRQAGAHATVTLAPMLAPERSTDAGELTQLALDALDHATRALHALYG